MGFSFSKAVGNLAKTVVKPVSSFLTPGTKALGSLFNNATGQSEANQWQWDMWNAQNEYNTPAAQRARLEAAGYNPMLMNNMGSSASGEAGSMTAKSGSGISPFEILSSIVNAQTGLSQASLIAEQARQLKHDNDLVEGTPIKSNDNSFLGRVGRALSWFRDNRSAQSTVSQVVNDAKAAVGGVFQGAAIPKNKQRILQDNLIKVRPGMRLDDALRRAEALSSGFKNAPRPKVWSGRRRGKYSNLAP